MQRNMAALLIAIVCVTGWTPSAAAQTAEAVHLATLDIAVWPEYDQPAVLVIYRAQIAGDVSMPARVTIRIPARAVGGKPHAVAVEDPTLSDPAQRLFNLPHTVDAQDEWLLISFTTAYRTFQVEFYDALDTGNPQRRYTLVWPGDVSVDQATLHVQAPFGSSELQVTPPVEMGQRGDDGLMYYPAVLGYLPAGQRVTIDLAYRKGDSRTSVEALGLAASVPPSRPIPAPSSALAWPGWMVVGILVGGGLLIAGLVWYLYSRRTEGDRPRPAAVRRDRRRSRDTRPHARARSERR